MSKFATSLLTLAIYTTALAVIPTATPAEAATGSGTHTKHKKKIRSGGSGYWSAGRARPVTRPYYGTGEVCPGIARSFDCRTWPPPMYDDPDRRVPGRL
jgi:hypothetical protein